MINETHKMSLKRHSQNFDTMFINGNITLIRKKNQKKKLEMKELR